MRIGLLTDGGCPYATGESGLWCDRLVRGLPQHAFDLFALSRSAHQEDQGWVRLPHHVGRVRTAPLWTPRDGALRGGGERGLPARLVTGGEPSCGRRDRKRFAAHLKALATAVCAAEDAGTEPATDGGLFTEGLYGLAGLARERGGLHLALRSETTVRILEAAFCAPGAGRTVQSATVVDHLAAAELERVLRPLPLDWYDQEGLGAVGLCHAVSGGAAALPGLLAKRFFGVPLLVTEHGVQLRAHYLSAPDAPFGAPVRALLTSFHRQLAAEVYRQAALVTAGNAHVRRWQQQCGADPAGQRTVYPGMAAERFSAVGEDDDAGGPGTLVRVGRTEPAKDLIALLHAFAEVRRAEPDARLRIFGAPAGGDEAAAYLARCRALAAQLFPDEATVAHTEGVSPVTFEEIGVPEVPDLAEAYAAGGVTVLSSAVEGFPISLVESMFCGRVTVSTDVGAVVEVIGGTGLVVPPRNPRAFADACIALLRDPERRARWGAAARARALELFTAEQNLAAFRGIYLELISHPPVRREADVVDAHGEPLLFATPAEARLPGRWTQPQPRPPEPGCRAGPPERSRRRPLSPSASTRPPAHRGTPMRDQPIRPYHGEDHPMDRPEDAAVPGRPAEIPPRAARRRTTTAPARRGPADPVKSLMHHHRDLCGRAVSPLEIAAGPEAHGLTDRTAARYRHRDVFALADELYARIPARPASTAPPPSRPDPDTGARAGWTLLALLPGAACLATAGLLRVTEGALGGGARDAVTVTGALLACLAFRLCLRRGPLRAPEGACRAGMYACWLLSFAVYGEELIAQIVSGGPDGPWQAAPAPLLGLTAAIAPAAWCAHFFTVRAHRKLGGSRALEEFAAGVRPLLLAAVTLFLCALLPLLFLAGLGLGGTGTPVAAVALGVLFFLARLLAAHGVPEPGTVALAAACAVGAAAPALVLGGRLPGLEPPARPVHALVAAGGPGAVPALACGAAALGLLVHACAALSRASAHTRD